MAKARTRREKVTEASVPGYDEIAYGIPASRGDGLRTIHAMNENQRDALEYLRSRTLAILTGPPGTAKTLLSVFVACERLQKRQIDKIYYVKPIVDTPGEKGIGYLPGSEMEKLEPHIASLRDALGVFMAKGKADYLIDKKIIEFLPIEHLRGRSLHRCMVIADEMQNATSHSVLTILSRLGDNSSIALLGDVIQRDLAGRFGKDGLSDAVKRLSHLDGFVGHVEFGIDDIVRSEFVRSVILAYSDLYESRH
jgi:phosphate starvation-inducible protein PhoH and related proteins